MKQYLIVIVTLFFINHSNAQTVATQFGLIQGTNSGGVYQFLGIPFAKPPIDSLRWKAPQNPTPWAGTLPTQAFAPMCPQKHFMQGDTSYTLLGHEDCLYLNIWTPQTGAGNRPVLVFIHGGGNQQGGASEVVSNTILYDGTHMALRGNAVIVTIQYRLGPLGFLVHPGLEAENANATAGNYAVLDQLLALRWIKNNISLFGADTNKIMIFGESAGGVNVGNLLMTSQSKGLFNSACIQSAVPDINDYASSKASGIAFADSFGHIANPIQQIAYLRTLPTDSLIKYETSPVGTGVVQQAWRPVVDGVLFTDFAFNIIQNGQHQQVPIMIGSNAQEMSLAAPAVVFPAMVTALINTSIPLAFQAQANALYPPGTNTTIARQSYINLLTDAQFTATTRRAAQCFSKNQTAPVWRYFFNHTHTVPLLAPYGSYHGMELFYIFNNWENAALGAGPLFKPADDSVQKNMLAYWVNFANSGNPNGTALATWPSYSAANDCYMQLQATPVNALCGLRTTSSNFWDSVMGFTGCTASIGVNPLPLNNNNFVYPNPTNGLVYFHNQLLAKPFTCKIYNAYGQLLNKLTNPYAINLSNYNNGVYIIAIETPSDTLLQKVVLFK